MTNIPDSVDSIRTSDSQLLVAFASKSGTEVDQHFGSASAFSVYDISADDVQLLARKELGEEKRDGNEDKLKPRLAWLAGSDAMYCCSVGGSATRQLIQCGITPLQITDTSQIEALIANIQAQLASEPEFWLANIMRQKQKAETDSDRFAMSAGESWE